MDGVDAKLLDLLQTDARQSLRRLGSTVGLSAAAVQRRIASHRKNRVIDRVVAIVNPARVGLPVVVFSLITFADDSPRSTHRLIQRLTDNPYVMRLHELAGDRDLVVVSVAATVDQYTDEILSVLETDSNVQRIETHISLRTHKDATNLPIEFTQNS